MASRTDANQKAIVAALRDIGATKTCPLCGTEFHVKPSHYDKRTYCSKACMAKAYKTRMAGIGNPHYTRAGYHICETCGQEFQSYNKARRFCSLSCRSKSPANIEQCRQMAQRSRPKRASNKNALRIPKQPKQKKEVVSSSHRHSKSLGVKGCKHCGQLFFVIGYDNRILCAACLSEFKRRSVRRCVVCGKSFRSVKLKKTCSRKCLSKHKSEIQRGEKSHRWQGGKVEQTRTIRNSEVYARWRRQVFRRDKFTCQMCGLKGTKLAAHHIKPFTDREDLRFVVPNGITLCWPCHHGIHGKEQQYEPQFLALTGGIW
jgi:5-methylcytosine-specific restriction endonuclease McrA